MGYAGQDRVKKLMSELKKLRELEGTDAYLEEGEQPERIALTTAMLPVVAPVQQPLDGRQQIDLPIGQQPILVMDSAHERRTAYRRLIFSAYLASLTLAEILTLAVSPVVGLVIYAVLAVVMILHSMLSQSVRNQRMLAALAFAPLLRIYNIMLPVPVAVHAAWYSVIGILLLAAAWVAFRYSRFTPSQVGLSVGNLPVQLLIGIVGIGIGYLEYLILRPAGGINQFSFNTLWLPALLLFLFAGLLTEFILRGLMQKAFIFGLGKAPGVLFVVLVSTLGNIGAQSALDVFLVFLVALFFGWIVLRTRSILGVTLAHGFSIICLYLVFPLLIG